VPGATTVWPYREQLVQAKAVEDLLTSPTRPNGRLFKVP